MDAISITTQCRQPNPLCPSSGLGLSALLCHEVVLVAQINTWERRREILRAREGWAVGDMTGPMLCLVIHTNNASMTRRPPLCLSLRKTLLHFLSFPFLCVLLITFKIVQTFKSLQNSLNAAFTKHCETLWRQRPNYFEVNYIAKFLLLSKIKGDLLCFLDFPPFPHSFKCSCACEISWMLEMFKVRTNRSCALQQKTLLLKCLISSPAFKSVTLWHHTMLPSHTFESFMPHG